VDVAQEACQWRFGIRLVALPEVIDYICQTSILSAQWARMSTSDVGKLWWSLDISAELHAGITTRAGREF
jgi:hypothetical protein